MKIIIGADHGGYECKKKLINWLKKKEYEVIDVGAKTYNPKDDYVDFAIKAAKKVQQDLENSVGILICKSGVGMYQVANKFLGIRAAEVRSEEEALMDRKHHNSNVLVLGGEIVDLESIFDIVQTWLSTDFEGGRHSRRIKKIDILEEDNMILNTSSTAVIPNLLFDQTEGYVEFGRIFEEFSSRIHVDIMDGNYVPSSSPTTKDVLEALSDNTAYLAYHLMVQNPDLGLMREISKHDNVNLVYTHIEVTPEEILSEEYPFEIGLAIKPGVDWKSYWHLIEKVSVLLILPINPGFYGAEFLPSELEKINEIREMGFEGEIHLDGSINKETMKTILTYSPDVLNIGSAIAKQSDPKKAWEELQDLVNELS